MIIAIIGNDPELCETLAAYLEVRSFNRITASNSAPEPGSPGAHHVLTGCTPEHLADLTGPAAPRVLFAGPAPAPDAPLAGIYERADLKMTADTPLERVASFVLDALAGVPRPGWDQYFIDIARVVSTRSNCMKRQVAAVVVRDRRVVATGYNGTPRGAKNCNEGGCERCNSLAPSGTGLDDCVCNHAEENAICQAAYHGISIRDATLYCTHSPCLRCAKLLINAGIREVVFNAEYPLAERARSLMEECGVICRKYPA